MADFQIAVQKTLIHEGGYVDNPEDSGGATNMGIEQRDLPNVPIKDLTVEQAIAYYSEHYWKQFYSQIEDQSVAEKLFDLGVLFGVGEAVKIFQLTLGVTDDDVFGPGTLQATNQAEPASLLAAYKTSMVTHAINIANANPNDRVFLVGWIKRINS
jgi:lysozyme family protein